MFPKLFTCLYFSFLIKLPADLETISKHRNFTKLTMVFRTLSQSLTSKSSLLLDDKFESPIRQRSNSTTKLKKDRRSGYTTIGEHEASDNFHVFDGDHCNTEENKIITMNQHNVQEPSQRQLTKTGFPEPFCGGNSSNTAKGPEDDD